MDHLRDLDIFLGDDDKATEQAFEKLMEPGSRVIHAYLRGNDFGLNQEDREDIVQQVTANVWKARTKIKNQGVAAWVQLLRRIAYNCAMDLFRASNDQRQYVQVQDVDELTEADQPLVEDIIHQILGSINIEEIQHQANLCFLGLDPDVSLVEHRRRLMAAQLYYQEGVSWSQILQIMGAELHGEPHLTRSQLDSLLSDTAVIRYLFFTEIFVPCVEITSHVLRVSGGLSDSDLSTLLRSALNADTTQAPPGGWTWNEVAIIILKYRYSLLDKSILSHSQISISECELESLFVRCDDILPFSSCMSTLLVNLNRNPAIDIVKTAAHTGLWQRLAFEYSFSEELPHKDIHKYLKPPANQASFKLSLDTLNTWISSRRLWEKLLKFHDQRGQKP